MISKSEKYLPITYNTHQSNRAFIIKFLISMSASNADAPSCCCYYRKQPELCNVQGFTIYTEEEAGR